MNLLKGELWLTVDILVGLAAGEIILYFGFAERFTRRLAPFLWRNGIVGELGLALALSLGSSKAGAALLAASLSDEKIDERTALWGTLMLPFPSYLRRWPATCAMAVGMAGTAGGIFALFLLARSAARFVTAFLVLKRGSAANLSSDCGDTLSDAPRTRHLGIIDKLRKTLPVAWLMFAVAYALVPLADDFFKSMFLGGSFLPLAGWTVAAGSIAHVSAALALAGGGIAAGELSVAQAVFALILGSALGLVSRVLRQNAGYYFGLFPPALARKMLFWNLATILPFVLLSLVLSAVPLLY